MGIPDSDSLCSQYNDALFTPVSEEAIPFNLIG